MQFVENVLEEKINAILDEIRKIESTIEEDRSPLHFEYIEELKENILELRRAKTVINAFTVDELQPQDKFYIFSVSLFSGKEIILTDSITFSKAAFALRFPTR